MGKFDGYLICSDLDGTFRNHEDIKPNCDAVKYFTDNGGKFTFATGRAKEHLEKVEYNHLINAPVCMVNGSIVYDYKQKKVLREVKVDFTIREFLDVVYKYNDADFRICVIYNLNGDSFEFFKNQDVSSEISDGYALKFICVFETFEEADKFKADMLKMPLFKDTYIAKSWEKGVEFNSVNATKGTAAEFIKSQLSDIHTLIGIGDQENDIPLLEKSDVAVAVGDCKNELRGVADLIVKPHYESSIADLINILDKIIK